MKKTQLEPQQVLMFLPCEPDGFHYSVEQVSPLVQRVWLHHEYPYDYACGTPVATVWGFIKSGKVHQPKNHKTAKAKSVCSITEAYTLSPYTTINVPGNCLTELL